MDIPRAVNFLSVHIDDLDILHSAYMPFLNRGGLFLSAALLREAGEFGGVTRLDDEFCLLLKLMNEREALCCTARVAWISPVRRSGERRAGLGLQFDENGASIRIAIESLLSRGAPDTLPSQTL